MAQFKKHFTLEEATALLPELRELISEIQEAHDHVIISVEEAIPVLRQARRNGGGTEAHAYLGDIQRLNAHLERVAELGIQVKDLEKGLVDFPHWRGEEEVFLCWHLGEDAIRYWHSLEGGIAGRRPLEG